MEEAATSLGADPIRSFIRVIFPLSKVSFMSNLIYYFMRSMVTISAVIFLVSPDVHLASIAVINLEKDGLEGPSAAMATLIIVVVIVAIGLLAITSKKKKIGKVVDIDV